MQACHQREREVLLLVTWSRQHFKFKRVPYFILLHTYTQDQDNYQDQDRYLCSFRDPP